MEGSLAFQPGAFVLGGYLFSGGTAGVNITFKNAELLLAGGVHLRPSTIAGTIMVPLNTGPCRFG